MKAAKRGFFIALEGIDGAGTTSQLSRLALALEEDGHAVVTTAEPSNGPIGNTIRQVLTNRLVLPDGRGKLTEETLALLFAADRLDHLASTIEPSLARGRIVLTCRYLASSLAYQGSAVGLGWITELNRAARSADLTLFFDLPLKVAAERRRRRGQPRERYEADSTLRTVAGGYVQAMKVLKKRGARLASIDASQSVEEVTRDALVAIRTLVSPR